MTYINREDAFNIRNYLKRFGCFGDNGFVEIEGVMIALSKIPSADVAPVRHGRWIYHMDDLYPEESTMECSVCGDFIFIRGESDNYCPNCGAKMDEGDTDEID